MLNPMSPPLVPVSISFPLVFGRESTLGFRVGTTALAADMLAIEPTVFPATEAILFKGVVCASKCAPCRDTVCLGSFTEKRILLLQYRWGNCENNKPQLAVNLSSYRRFVGTRLLAKFVVVNCPTETFVHSSCVSN